MAIDTFTDAHITVNGINVSDHVRSVDVPRAADEVDVTTFGNKSKARRQGLRDDAFVLNVFTDFEANELHSVLEPLFENKSSFTVVVRPYHDSPVSMTNPQFVGTCCIMEYDPFNAEAGQASMTQVTLPTYSGHIREETTATYS